MKVLLVEDNEALARALIEVFIDKQNYVVDTAADGETGWQLIEASPYSLIVLDVMLPKLDGISLCQRLRRQGYVTPVLLLTARDSSSDRVMGLDAGADDYVIKPFDLPELLARMRALLRRSRLETLPEMEWAGLRLDPSCCRVSYQAENLLLTPKEYNLIELLLRHQGQLLSRAAIIRHLWSMDAPPTDDTVKVHMKSLRKKLKAAGAPSDLVATVYGMGYRLG
jgi:DNA-binding response OmpR family regulator